MELHPIQNAATALKDDKVLYVSCISEQKTRCVIAGLSCFAIDVSMNTIQVLKYFICTKESSNVK